MKGRMERFDKKDGKDDVKCAWSCVGRLTSKEKGASSVGNMTSQTPSGAHALTRSDTGVFLTHSEDGDGAYVQLSCCDGMQL